MQYILFLIILLSANSAAQRSGDNNSSLNYLDVRELLQMHIEAVKFQQAELQNNFNSTVVHLDNVNHAGIPKKVLANLFVLFEACLFALLVIIWIKYKHKIIKYREKILKRNIEKLRQEKIESTKDSHLEEIRNALMKKSIKIDDKGIDITAKAKEYSIAKGEVYLAAKLKILSGEYD